MAILKTLIFSVAPCFSLLAGAELSARIIYYQAHAPFPFAMIQVYGSLRNRVIGYKGIINAEIPTVKMSRSLFVSDPILGFKTTPGSVITTYRIAGRKLNVTELVGEDGYRATSLKPAMYGGKPDIWFFGCSYTWGETLNDNQTFPWLVQQSMPQSRVRNLARQAYGNLHALLQLESAANAGEKLLRIAVFTFNYFHPARNVGSPSWLQGVHSLLHSSYPRALIGPDGNFTTESVPLTGESWRGQKDPDDSYTEMVSRVIFYRIFQFCAAHRIAPVFALQDGSPENAIVKYAAKVGFTVVNISVDLNADHGLKYRSLPFDRHPNAAAHELYFERIMPTLKSLMTSGPA